MSRLRVSACCIAALTIAGCGEEPTTPRITGEVHVAIVSGDGQTGSAGQELPQPLVVRVVGSNGKGIRGQLVNFRVATGGGRMYAGSSLTDMNGVAQDYWTLGAPGPQQVEVVAVDPTTGSKQNFDSFAATATAPAALAIAPPGVNFGTLAVGATSSASVITVSNTGGEPSGVLSLALGGTHAADFQVLSTTCSGALAAGASCTASVRFAPTGTGARSGSLNVSASPGGSVSSSLSGSGIIPAQLVWQPTSLVFPARLVGSTSPSQNITLINNGGSPATNVTFAIGGSNASDYTIIGSNCVQGMTLAPGQGCVVGITFTPSAAGPRAGFVSATATGGIVSSAVLDGSGIAPAQLSISPLSNTFPAEPVGNVSPAVTFTITNTGQQTSGVVAITLGGAHAQDFNIPTNLCLQQVLQSGQSCNVIVNFSPSAAGVRTATLSASASPGGTVGATLSGTGTIPGAQLSITPLSHGFGSVVVGGSPATRSFTITNVGQSSTGSLTLSLLGTGAAHYALSNDNCAGATLAGGASCTVTVEFDPSVDGTHVASLQASATPGGTVGSTLSGTGVLPVQLSVNPTSLAFGNRIVRQTGAPQRITITNTGQSVASLFEFSLQGASLDYFLSSSCTSVAPGASCFVDVFFVPTVLGVRLATLNITAPGFTSSVSLSGTGI